MDAQRLRVLREFADRGSVAATAAAMHCSPSAVSQQLKLLQREAGVRLLVKSGRGLILTEAGRALARAGVEVTVALERADAVLADYRQGASGVLHASFFPSGAQMLLPGILAWLADNAPEITLEAHYEEPAWQDAPRLTADYDLVIAHSGDGPLLWRGPVVVPLFREPLDIAVPLSHPLADRPDVTAAEVVEYPFIGVPENFPFHREMTRIEERAGKAIRVVQRFPDLPVMESLIEAGIGIGLLARFTARTGAGTRFLLKPLRDVETGRTLAVLTRPDRAEHPAVRRVLTGLREVGRVLERSSATVVSAPAGPGGDR